MGISDTPTPITSVIRKIAAARSHPVDFHCSECFDWKTFWDMDSVVSVGASVLRFQHAKQTVSTAGYILCSVSACVMFFFQLLPCLCFQGLLVDIGIIRCGTFSLHHGDIRVQVLRD